VLSVDQLNDDRRIEIERSDDPLQEVPIANALTLENDKTLSDSRGLLRSHCPAASSKIPIAPTAPQPFVRDQLTDVVGPQPHRLTPSSRI
jgi:hypothetical protein